MFTLVLFALFFAVPLVWLVLATTKNGEQLYFGAPLSFGSVNHLVRNWGSSRKHDAPVRPQPTSRDQIARAKDWYCRWPVHWFSRLAVKLAAHLAVEVR
jgi:ABC-type glycerol-3-phosphate transport system permease component